MTSCSLFAVPTLSFVLHSSIVNYGYVCKYSSLLDQFLVQILLTAICKDHEIHSITHVHWEVFISNRNRDRPNFTVPIFQACILQSVLRCMNISACDVMLGCTVYYVHIEVVPLVVSSGEHRVSMKSSQQNIIRNKHNIFCLNNVPNVNSWIMVMNEICFKEVSGNYFVLDCSRYDNCWFKE